MIADLLADVLREVLVLERRAVQNVLEVRHVLGAAVSLEPAVVNATHAVVLDATELATLASRQPPLGASGGGRTSW